MTEGPLPLPTACRSCGALIRFAQGPSGKAIPLDAEPVPHVGEYAIVFRPPASAHAPAFLAVPLQAFRVHFATCPDADKWRRDKGGVLPAQEQGS